MSLLVAVAYVFGFTIGVVTGEGKLLTQVLSAAAIAVGVIGAGFVTERNAHAVERALLVVNLPLILLVSLDSVSTGMLMYYPPVILHVVYTERVPLIRYCLLGAYAAAFFVTFAFMSTAAYVPAAPGSKLLFEFAAAFFSILMTGYNLRRFRRFNGTARAELAAREAVLEGHVASMREGRAALERKARDTEGLKRASRESIGREEAARAQIEAQAEEMRQFAYAASHDLKEPVRTIRSFVQMTRRRLPSDYALDAESAEFFDHIDGATAAMATLLDRLLLYSRAERRRTGEGEVTAERLLRAATAQQRVRVVPPPPSLRETRVTAAVDRVDAIVAELVDNALRFSDSEVEVGLRQGADLAVEVYVADRGVGVPEEYAERVFGLFQRLHGRDEYPGHGIGLALCRRLLGGEPDRLRLEARAGGGTFAVLRA